MTALFVIAIVFGYLFGVGVTFSGVASRIKGKPMDTPGPTFAGTFWPILVPIFLGIYAARTPERRRVTEQLKALHQREEKQRLERENRELDRELAANTGAEVESLPPAKFALNPNQFREKYGYEPRYRHGTWPGDEVPFRWVEDSVIDWTRFPD